MAGYVRQSAGSITDGATIQASHFNNEYNQLESAFAAATGHDHTGGVGLAPQIALSGASQGVTGTLAVGSGGTGVTTLTDGGVLLGSGTSAVTALAVLANGSIIVGDGATDPVALAAFTSSTGTLKHESGGIEANISAIADGGILVGTGAGTIAVRASVLTAGAAGFLKHELGGLEFNASAITTDQFLGGTSAGVIGIRTAAQVTTSLTLTIGTNTQAWDANLDQIAALAPTNNNFIVGNGTAWTLETPANVRSSLGLVIGTDVQAEDLVLTDLAALTAVVNNEFIVGTGAGTYAHESGATARTSIGLGVADLVTFEQINVNNLRLDANTFSATSGAITITPAGGSALNLDDTNFTVDGGVVAITGQLSVDNLRFNGNTISSTDVNGNISLNPNGTGDVSLPSGRLFLNDTVNTKMTVGVTVQLGANDDEAIALKSTDVVSTFTTQAESDTFATFQKAGSTSGGLTINGFSTDNIAIQIIGHADATDIADTDTTADVGVILFEAYEDTGTTRQAVTTGNIFVVRNGTVARMLLKEDGELHIGQTTLVQLVDDKNDVELLRAFDHDKASRGAKGLIRSRWDDFVNYNKNDLIDAGIIGKDSEDGAKGLWNISQHIQLLNGATWQLYTALKETQERLTITENKLKALPITSIRRLN